MCLLVVSELGIAMVLKNKSLDSCSKECCDILTTR